MNFTKILIVILTIFTLSLQAKDIKLTETSNQFVITNKSLSEFTFVSHLSEINTLKVKTDVGEFVKILVMGYGENAKDGDAELPVLEELINVPFGSSIAIKVLNIEQQIISLSDYGIDNLVFPSQPSISKGENAEDVPFYFNEGYYNYDGFYETDIVTTELLGKMRGQQLARLSVAPFQYNPTTNQLKVITKLEVRIIFKNIDFEGHKLNKQKYYSPEFEHVFKGCINYVPLQAKDVITTYPVKYVIIADPAFQSELQPLVEWKTKKGVQTELVDVADIGDADAIKAYVEEYYY